jgi:hypothetical protein
MASSTHEREVYKNVKELNHLGRPRSIWQNNIEVDIKGNRMDNFRLD